MFIGRYALGAFISFLGGATAANFNIGFVVALAVLFVVHFWILSDPKAKYLIDAGVFMLSVAAFLFGYFYYFLFLSAEDYFSKIPSKNENVVFTAKVREEPRETPKSLRFDVDLSDPYHGRIKIITEPKDIRYGDVLSIDGKISEEENSAVVLFPKIQIQDRNKGFWLWHRLLDLKLSVIDGFKHLLPVQNAALLSGITLGARGGFTEKMREEMSLSGTSHIVAVSGYNIGILAISISNVAAYFLSRRVAIILAIFTILIFVGIVGTEASVVRAALMGILGLTAEGVGRPNDQAYAISIAAFFMVMWDPTVIGKDVGFLLSFMSLLGVVYLSPAIRSLWRSAENKGFLAWKENVDTTLSAQLGVLPILLLVFGNASFSSIFANVLILPLIPLTMGTGFFLGAANSISFLIAFVAAKFAEILTTYELWIIELFSKFSIPIWNVFWNPVVIIFYYFLLALFIINRNRAKTLRETS